SVSLPGNNLRGALPNLALPQCRLLSLSRNTLRDTMPILGGLPNVEAVDLSRNEIDGHLFDFNLPNATMLDLSYNKIEGPVPDFSRMPNLRTLRLNDNRLDGGLPDFSNMKGLINLWMANNLLDGPIPEFNFLPDLLVLYLSNNRFVGSAPAFRGSPQLFVVDLSHNDLSGFIPSFSRLLTLQTLKLNNNRITGPISSFSANTQLEELDISHNLLEGTLPNITFNKKITDFNASNNNFSGNIPSYAGLADLQRLDVSNNQLGDTLPDLSYLESLDELRVDSNNYSHSLFDASTAPSLQVFEVQYNRFTISDLFMINGQGLNRFVFAQQKRFSMPDTIYTTIGEDVTIDLLIDPLVGANVYNWYQDDVLKVSTQVNELIINSINALDQGTYYVRVTNDAFDGLNLLSEEFYVQMDCPYNEVVIDDSLCIGDTLYVNGKAYFETGDYRDTVIVPEPTVCDSIFIISIAVYPNYDTTLLDTICESDQVMFGGEVITESGMYTDTLTSIHGCDSIVHLNLVVYPAYTRARDVDICAGDTLFVGNIIHTTSGLYTDTLQTINGCDSVIITDLAVMDTFLSVTNVELCFGETYEFRGQTYSSSGTYVDALSNAIGCDSTYVLNLFIPESDHYPVNETICAGDSVMVGDSVYKEAGTYTDSLVTGMGCDSIVVLTLMVTDKFEEEYDLTICRGDTLFFGDDTLTTTGIYIDSLTALGGCDSIVKVVLNVLSFVNINIDTTICFGDSIAINDNIYKVDGTFLDTLPGENCDTIITTDITVNPEITIDEVRTVFHPSGTGFIQPTLSGGTTPYSYQWNTGASTQILDSVLAGLYNLTITDQLGCTASFDLELDPATSVNQFSESIAVHMFPNPIRKNEGFNISVEGAPAGDYNFIVYDLHGRVIDFTRRKINQAYEVVELRAPDYAGLYTVKIADAEGRFTMRKLMVH
ncbi:MAG: T9SS type A sorting domain-containing protein, partial [Saprospiraceae bacterium]|nr:T9SS type A sorting domain-containing protein [Saprospiraceae bacterium]